MFTYLESKSMVISKEEFQSYNNDVGRAFLELQTKMKKLLKGAKTFTEGGCNIHIMCNSPMKTISLSFGRTILSCNF